MMKKIQEVKKKLSEHLQLEKDQLRVKKLLDSIKEKEIFIHAEQKKPKPIHDPIRNSYLTKKLDEDLKENEQRRGMCNSIYMQIKSEYDDYVFDNEITFYELYDKMKDIEELLQYLK